MKTHQYGFKWLVMNAYGSTCVVLSSDLWLFFVVPLNLTFLFLTLTA